MTNLPLRRNLRRLLASGCLLASVAGLPALEPGQWQHRQPLAIEQAGVIKFTLPVETLDHARPALEDLRLLDPAGRETPFVLERPAPIVPPTTQPPRTFRVALTATGTELTLETGTATPLAAVVVHTPAPAFLKAARLEVSADGDTWEVIETGAPLFRQFGTEQLRLELPPRVTAIARLRLTLDDTRTRPIPVTGATLLLRPAARPPLTAPLPVRIAHREEFAGETVLTLDLGARHVDLAALEIATADPLFTRQVSVTVRELRDDAAVERTLASGAIYRVAVDGLAPRAQLTVPVHARVPARELLLHIVNGDSPPLAIDAIHGRRHPVHFIFRADAPGGHTLLTGNPDTAAPRYDLAALAGSFQATPVMALAPGPTELNPGYRRVDALAATPLLGGPLDPAPWTYRKAVLLDAAGVQQLELDPEVLARAHRSFADLRLVRDGTQVPYLLERPALSRSLALNFTAAPDPKNPRLSRWALKLPQSGLPLTRLTLTADTALFQRHLRLFERVTDDRGGPREWTFAEADWSRTPGGTSPLVLNLGATPTTDTLYLETDNGDNPPLALRAVTGAHAVTRLLFKADVAPLALYYGNREIGAPRYDASLVAGQIFAAEKSIARLGPEERVNAAGWTAGTLAGLRSGFVLWSVLGLVVVALLVIVARLLPKPPPTA